MARNRDRLWRVLALALPAAAPAVAIFAGLGFAGLLSPVTALSLAAVTLVAAALMLGRLAIAIAGLGALVAALAAEELPGTAALRLPVGPWRMVSETRHRVQRLARHWRERDRATAARLVTAEAIVERAPDPLILLDGRRQIVRANRAAAEVVGSFAPPCDLAAALRNPAVLAAADAVLRSERARSVEFVMTAPVERQLRARFARIDDLTADTGAAVLTLQDITELKRVEQTRADFIANASHELRTPLATLAGFIETLRGPAREDAEARERFLAIMAGQATRMARLVEDLLSLSRIELNEHIPPQGRVALAPLLQHLADALELRAGERNMRIRLSVPSDLPEVQGDRDELAQVFQNLLDNAIKYGRADTEINVEAAIRDRAPSAAGRAGLARIAVAVRDQGEGIAREHLPRLTERFYRADTLRSREMGGTGLGLAIVKHIVNRHRGTLEINSTLGEGPVFTVVLRQYPTDSTLAP